MATALQVLGRAQRDHLRLAQAQAVLADSFKLSLEFDSPEEMTDGLTELATVALDRGDSCIGTRRPHTART